MSWISDEMCEVRSQGRRIKSQDSLCYFFYNTSFEEKEKRPRGVLPIQIKLKTVHLWKLSHVRLLSNRLRILKSTLICWVTNESAFILEKGGRMKTVWSSTVGFSYLLFIGRCLRHVDSCCALNRQHQQDSSLCRCQNENGTICFPACLLMISRPRRGQHRRRVISGKRRCFIV